MTRTGKRLIQDFIIPSLNAEKYGELLQWTDKEQRIFQLKWSHKNAARWSSEDTNVFQDWDRLKGHYYPDKEGYFMQAKQRFRAALQKLKNHVRRLDNDEKGFKRYKLLNDDKKVKNEKEKKKQVRKTETAIRTPVICENLTYNGKLASSSSSSMSSSFPSSPSSSQESNMSIESSDLENLEQSYKSAQERQMKSYEKDISPKDEALTDSALSDEAYHSDQKENLQSQTQGEPPHAPIESRCNIIRTCENFSKPQFVSPQVLLVKTHYESCPKPMRNYNNVGCVMYDCPSALNLSVKQEV